MLQFYSRDGPVVLNDAGNVEDRKAQWFYCLTDKPMALSMESGEKMLKTHIDDAGKLMPKMVKRLIHVTLFEHITAHSEYNIDKQILSNSLYFTKNRLKGAYIDSSFAIFSFCTSVLFFLHY